MSELKTGTVIWFSNKKGFGFIKVENEKDVFVHYTDIDCEGYRTLKNNDRVQFNIGTNHKGDPKAVNVKVVNLI